MSCGLGTEFYLPAEDAEFPLDGIGLFFGDVGFQAEGGFAVGLCERFDGVVDRFGEEDLAVPVKGPAVFGDEFLHDLPPAGG